MQASSLKAAPVLRLPSSSVVMFVLLLARGYVNEQESMMMAVIDIATIFFPIQESPRYLKAKTVLACHDPRLAAHRIDMPD